LRVAWTKQISKSRSGNFVMLDRLRARFAKVIANLS
jgi:hypothetical protein